MVKIRLARGGAKKNPFYSIVATDSRKPRDSGYIERIGYFNPVARGQEVRLQLQADRLSYWQSKGAQISSRVKQLAKEFKDPTIHEKRLARQASEAKMVSDKLAVEAKDHAKIKAPAEEEVGKSKTEQTQTQEVQTKEEVGKSKTEQTKIKQIKKEQAQTQEVQTKEEVVEAKPSETKSKEEVAATKPSETQSKTTKKPVSSASTQSTSQDEKATVKTEVAEVAEVTEVPEQEKTKKAVKAKATGASKQAKSTVEEKSSPNSKKSTE